MVEIFTFLGLEQNGTFFKGQGMILILLPPTAP